MDYVWLAVPALTLALVLWACLSSRKRRMALKEERIEAEWTLLELVRECEDDISKMASRLKQRWGIRPSLEAHPNRLWPTSYRLKVIVLPKKPGEERPEDIRLLDTIIKDCAGRFFSRPENLVFKVRIKFPKVSTRKRVA